VTLEGLKNDIRQSAKLAGTGIFYLLCVLAIESIVGLAFTSHSGKKIRATDTCGPSGILRILCFLDLAEWARDSIRMSKHPTKQELKQLGKFFEMGFGPSRADQYVMPCSICGVEWGADEPWHWCPVCGKSLTPKPQLIAS